MTGIFEALEADIPTIQSIARITWPVTYGPILSDAQVDFMLDKFYNAESLKRNMADGQRFHILEYDGKPAGFYALQPHYKSQHSHLHKIYLLPDFQGKGLGSVMLSDAEDFAQKNGAKFLSLNVNRFNPARNFYERHGFEIVETVDIPIGDGYLMEDYIMRKIL